MNYSSKPETLLQKLCWGLDRGAFRSAVGRALARAVYLGVDDQVTRQLVDSELRELRKLEFTGQLPPFQTVQLQRGEIPFGVDFYGQPVRIPLRALCSGTLLAGNTGAGKTHFLKWVLPKIAGAGVTVWVTESHKTELRRLRHLMPGNLIILRPQDWRYNPLQCFLADPSMYLVVIVDLLCRVLHLPPRARLVLSELLYHLYARFGIWAGHRSCWPTLYDLVEELRKSDQVNPAAKEALFNRLTTLLMTLKPQRVAYRSGWNPLHLSEHCIDFEMRGATEVEKQLFFGAMLATVFHQKVESGLANSTLSLLVAMDDAQRFVATESEAESNDAPPLAELASVGRSPGIGLWLNVQTLIGFSPRFVPQLANKFFGQLGSATDYQAFASHMSLTGEQVDHVNHFLKPGWFVGQISIGDCREPFLFNLPTMPELPAITDAEASASCEALAHLPVEPAHDFDHWQPFPTVEIETPANQPLPPLDDTELRFLRAVVSRPGQPSSFYAHDAGLNGQRAAKTRSKLVDRGCLREHSVALGTRGRTSIVLEPLAPAYAALGQNTPNSAFP